MTCSVLISPLVAGQIPNPARFQQMLYDGRRIVQEWRDRAYAEERTGPDHQPVALVFGWLGFNGWAMCVTNADTDADCIRHLAADTPLTRRFADMKQQSAAFGQPANQFAAQWPVLSSKHYRKLVGDPFAHPPTPAIVDRYTRAKRSRFEPRCYVNHVDTATPPAPDWAHTIRAIYQVAMQSSAWREDHAPAS